MSALVCWWEQYTYLQVALLRLPPVCYVVLYVCICICRIPGCRLRAGSDVDRKGTWECPHPSYVIASYRTASCGTVSYRITSYGIASYSLVTVALLYILRIM